MLRLVLVTACLANLLAVAGCSNNGPVGLAAYSNTLAPVLLVPAHALLVVPAGRAALRRFIVAVAGARYAERPPSPYLGRAADVLDVLCVVSVLPIACAVLGLYGAARGWLA